MADATVRAPKQPFRRGGKTAPTHHREPLEKSTAGKLYRVRDKVVDGAFNTWGENLSYDAAVKLKESVAGRRLSKTVRVEEMDAKPYVGTVPPNPWRPDPAKREDPYLEEVRQKAARAVAPIAAQAQQRHQVIVQDNFTDPVSAAGAIELPDPDELGEVTPGDLNVDDLLEDDGEDETL